MSNDICEIEAILDQELEFHSHGQIVRSNKVLLKAPSAKNRKSAFTMKQMFMRAVMSQQEMAAKNSQVLQEENKKDAKVQASDIISLVMASNECFDHFNEQFKDMLCAGCGSIEGEKFTKPMYDELSLDDAEKLLGEYIQAFLMKSLI